MEKAVSKKEYWRVVLVVTMLATMCHQHSDTAPISWIFERIQPLVYIQQLAKVIQGSVVYDLNIAYVTPCPLFRKNIERTGVTLSRDDEISIKAFTLNCEGLYAHEWLDPVADLLSINQTLVRNKREVTQAWYDLEEPQRKETTEQEWFHQFKTSVETYLVVLQNQAMQIEGLYHFLIDPKRLIDGVEYHVNKTVPNITSYGLDKDKKPINHTRSTLYRPIHLQEYDKMYLIDQNEKAIYEQTAPLRAKYVPYKKLAKAKFLAERIMKFEALFEYALQQEECIDFFKYIIDGEFKIEDLADAHTAMREDLRLSNNILSFMNNTLYHLRWLTMSQDAYHLYNASNRTGTLARHKIFDEEVNNSGLFSLWDKVRYYFTPALRNVEQVDLVLSYFHDILSTPDEQALTNRLRREVYQDPLMRPFRPFNASDPAFSVYDVWNTHIWNTSTGAIRPEWLESKGAVGSGCFYETSQLKYTRRYVRELRLLRDNLKALPPTELYLLRKTNSHRALRQDSDWRSVGDWHWYSWPAFLLFPLLPQVCDHEQTMFWEEQVDKTKAQIEDILWPPVSNGTLFPSTTTPSNRLKEVREAFDEFKVPEEFDTPELPFRKKRETGIDRLDKLNKAAEDYVDNNQIQFYYAKLHEIAINLATQKLNETDDLPYPNCAQQIDEHLEEVRKVPPRSKRETLTGLLLDAAIQVGSNALGAVTGNIVTNLVNWVVDYFNPSSSYNRLNDLEAAHNKMLSNWNVQMKANLVTADALEELTALAHETMKRLDTQVRRFPQFTWLSGLIITKISAAGQDIRKIRREAVKGRVATEELSRLTDIAAIQEIDPVDTQLLHLERLSDHAINVKFRAAVASKDTNAYRIRAFRHWDNLDDVPRLIEYAGAAYVIRNETSNCIKALSSSPDRYISEQCTKTDGEDKQIRQWKTVAETEDLEKFVNESQVIKTLGYNYVYCFPGNITIEGRTHRCPTEPFRLKPSIAFETAQHTHTPSVVAISATQELGIEKVHAGHFNEDSDIKQHLDMFEKLRDHRRQLRNLTSQINTEKLETISTKTYWFWTLVGFAATSCAGACVFGLCSWYMRQKLTRVFARAQANTSSTRTNMEMPSVAYRPVPMASTPVIQFVQPAGNFAKGMFE